MANLNVSGNKILLSGSVIVEDGEDVFIDNGIKPTLRLSFDSPTDNSMTGGTFDALEGKFPLKTFSGRSVYGFGVGNVGGLTRSARIFVEDHIGAKVIIYTVVEQ